MVDLLLKHSSKADHQTKTGCTPLMEATRFALMTLHINVVPENLKGSLEKGPK